MNLNTIKNYPRLIITDRIHKQATTTQETIGIERNTKGKILKVNLISIKHTGTGNTIAGSLGYLRNDYFIPISELFNLTVSQVAIFNGDIFLQEFDKIACQVISSSGNINFQLSFNGIESFARND